MFVLIARPRAVERRNYLGRLIVEEQRKQKDAGDSEYQY
jgi:hypothetical protein